MSWDYRLANIAIKALKRFPRNDQRQIFEALESMKHSPFSGDTRPIQGETNLFRRRVGAYRIYFRPVFTQHLLDIPEISRKQSH